MLRWLESPGIRLVEVDGEWTCPVAGATRHLAVHDAVSQSRRSLVPFADRRGLGAGAPAGALSRDSVPRMITAIVFVKADVAQIPEVADAIAALDGVSEVYSVTGQIDLIALVRVREHDDVASVVADRLEQGPRRERDRDAHRVPRLLQHDLESAFSLGLD